MARSVMPIGVREAGTVAVGAGSGGGGGWGWLDSPAGLIGTTPVDKACEGFCGSAGAFAASGVP
jgi:hypothetical protein